MKTALPILAALLLSACTCFASTLLWTVHGTSMLPVLHAGQIVAAVPTSYADLRLGDICIYRNFRGVLTIHRIVGGWSGKWVMRGDNNARADQWYMTPGRYLSRVIQANGNAI